MDGSSFFEDTLPKCKNQALVYLTMREHNRKELELKLKTKGYGKDTIEETLNALTDDNSLSEERYIRSFIRSSNRRHAEGKTNMIQRLLAKGADKSTALTIVNEVYGDEEYVQLLLEEALKNLQKKGKAENKEQLRFCLMKLGFSSSDLRNCDKL